MWPVSYTHLIKKIYTKRFNTITQYLGRGTLDEQTAAMMKALAKSKLEKALQDNDYAQGSYAAEMEPVSYTHLDVYKRQHLSVSSLYCSLANDAFVELYSRHFEDGLTCNMEECMLPDVLRQVSTGLTEIGVITIFSDIESLTMRRIEDAGLEFNLILRRPLQDVYKRQPTSSRT